ncbi:serine hydrolase FSH [Xylariaceae sp. FL0255]|nr:serine hydrolase FSH [Xylariaceae sp. FL0255]
MRFLCLHGSGTNTSVLKSQTGPLRHELGEDHEYDFVEAVIPCAPAQGVEALSSPGHDYFAFFDPADLETLQTAVDQLDRYVDAEGPYDGILGFSAGSALGAMYILHRQQKSLTVPFKCAVFLSNAEIRDEMAHLDIDPVRCSLIAIPTAHIWGSNDTTAPNGGQDLSDMCEPTMRFTFVHDGGHELPSADRMTDACHMIRRAIQQTRLRNDKVIGREMLNGSSRAERHML